MRIQDAAVELNSMYEQAGLAPEALGPWSGWRVFKAFLRRPAEAPDEGVSVQYGTFEGPGQPASFELYWVRQFAEFDVEGAEVPLRRVVTELAFTPSRPLGLTAADLWSYDDPSLDDFLARVEADPTFQAAMNAPVVRSDVYAEEL